MGFILYVLLHLGAPNEYARVPTNFAFMVSLINYVIVFFFSYTTFPLVFFTLNYTAYILLPINPGLRFKFGSFKQIETENYYEIFLPARWGLNLKLDLPAATWLACFFYHHKAALDMNSMFT